MSQYEIAEQAIEDLSNIWDYHATYSEKAANRLLKILFDAFDRLSDMPGIGRERDDLAPGLRSIASGKYVIFYQLAEDTIRIKRVLRGSRFLDNLFR